MAAYTIVNYLVGTEARAGLLIDGQVIDLAVATGRPAFAGIAELLTSWDEAIPLMDAAAADATAARVPLASVTLLAPVPAPLAVYCMGANFQEHLDRMMRVQNSPLQPNARDAGMPPYFFLKSGHCVVPTGTDVELSGNKLDWEAELTVVIGRKTRNVTAGDAMASIAGYTVANDLSARDRAVRRNGIPTSPFFFDFVAQKSFDGSCPLGPGIVPAKYVGDPEALSIKLWVNDVLRIDGSSADMIYPIAEQIAFLSTFVTLYPGDLVLTGTPAGVGAETGEYLQRGDRVRVTIDGIGTIENRIV